MVVSGGVARRAEDRFFRRRRSSCCLPAVFSEHWQSERGLGEGNTSGLLPSSLSATWKERFGAIPGWLAKDKIFDKGSNNDYNTELANDEALGKRPAESKAGISRQVPVYGRKFRAHFDSEGCFPAERFWFA